MKSGISVKKSTIFLLLFLILLLVALWHHLFSQPTFITSDHATLTLTPFTAREQKDLIQAQEQEEQLDVSGPLTARMTVPQAEDHVLNLSRNTKN